MSAMPRVGNEAGRVLERYLGALCSQWADYAAVVDKLRGAGLELTYARPRREHDSRSTWILHARPSDVLRNRLELSPEIAILCTPWPEIHAEDLTWAEEVLGREDRVDPGFVLVVTADRDAEHGLAKLLPSSPTYIFLHEQVLLEDLDPAKLVETTLRDHLGRRRLFDLRTPASGRQFFGRSREREALERSLMQGRCVGLFGLRKIGKTSLILQLVEKNRQRPTGQKMVVGLVDLQKVPFNARNLAGIHRELGRALRTEHPELFATVGQEDERIRELVAAGRRVVIIVDEYERLVAGSSPIEGGVEFLAWLRGLAQSSEQRFSFVLIGRDERPIRAARIKGEDNPVYRFIEVMPLGGLAESDCRTMMTTIGGRSLLRFADDALREVYETSGGHPMLARTIGDLVDQEIDVRRRPTAVGRRHVASVMDQFRVTSDEDLRELLDAALDIDAGARERLRRLAFEGPSPATTPEAKRIDKALVDYGLLTVAGELKIGAFADWLRDNLEGPSKVAHG